MSVKANHDHAVRIQMKNNMAAYIVQIASRTKTKQSDIRILFTAGPTRGPALFLPVTMVLHFFLQVNSLRPTGVRVSNLSKHQTLLINVIYVVIVVRNFRTSLKTGMHVLNI